MDAYWKIRGTMAELAKTRVTPTSPIMWQELHDIVSRAYRKGMISDNEYDDLLNRLLRRGRD